MITEIKKSRKSLFLEKMRELATNDDLLLNNIDNLLMQFKNSSPVYCYYSVIENELNNLSFDGFILKINDLYKIFSDDHALKKQSEKFFGLDFTDKSFIMTKDEINSHFASNDKIRNYGVFSYYSFINDLNSILSGNYRTGIKDSVDLFFEAFAFKLGLKISCSKILKDHFLSRNKKIQDLDEAEIRLLAMKMGIFPIRNLTIKIFIDIDSAELTFEESQNTLKIGVLEIGVSKEMKPTPLLNAILTNDKEKINNRLKSQIAGMLKKSYKLYLTEEKTASSYLKGNGVHPLFVSEKSIANLGDLLEVKSYFKKAGESEMEKILRSIESYLRE
ncbi:MAG: hypothetical protein HXM94_01260 [Parvimonas micra]|uniref:Uncharacterized protein n=1 Tax=Parvimonas micra TaxID=33033 RepID=A0A930E0N0_9FIRM|nr:hypothetical protein [Parvimonas micra]MBF1306405.1 hypothetical protein [Parvimonas micra]